MSLLLLYLRIFQSAVNSAGWAENSGSVAGYVAANSDFTFMRFADRDSFGR
jgi:hypothetical protein